MKTTLKKAKQTLFLLRDIFHRNIRVHAEELAAMKDSYTGILTSKEKHVKTLETALDSSVRDTHTALRLLKASDMCRSPTVSKPWPS